jgi:hypothetical protein
MKTQTIIILAALGIAGYYFYNKSKSNITDSKPMPTTPGTTPATKGRLVTRVTQQATAAKNLAKK